MKKPLKKKVAKKKKRPPTSVRFSPKEEKVLRARAKKLKGKNKSVARVIRTALGFDKG